MQQWNYITIRQAKTKTKYDFPVLSWHEWTTNSHILSWTAKKLYKIQQNITMYKMTTM